MDAIDRTGRLVRQDDVVSGRVTIRGLRVTADHVIAMLAAGLTWDQILREFPVLERADLEACEAYATEQLLRLHHTTSPEGDLADLDEDMREALSAFARRLADRSQHLLRHAG